MGGGGGIVNQTWDIQKADNHEEVGRNSEPAGAGHPTVVEPD